MLIANTQFPRLVDIVDDLKSGRVPETSPLTLEKLTEFYRGTQLHFASEFALFMLKNHGKIAGILTRKDTSLRQDELAEITLLLRYTFPALDSALAQRLSQQVIRLWDKLPSTTKLEHIFCLSSHIFVFWRQLQEVVHTDPGDDQLSYLPHDASRELAAAAAIEWHSMDTQHFVLQCLVNTLLETANFFADSSLSQLLLAKIRQETPTIVIWQFPHHRITFHTKPDVSTATSTLDIKAGRQKDTWVQKLLALNSMLAGISIAGASDEAIMHRYEEGFNPLQVRVDLTRYGVGMPGFNPKLLQLLGQRDFSYLYPKHVKNIPTEMGDWPVMEREIVKMADHDLIYCADQLYAYSSYASHPANKPSVFRHLKHNRNPPRLAFNLALETSSPSLDLTYYLGEIRSYLGRYAVSTSRSEA